jgi:predicted RNA-binding protein
MCEANAYLKTAEGKEELLMEDVSILRSEKQGIYLQSLFGEKKVVKAHIKEMHLSDHRIYIGGGFRLRRRSYEVRKFKGSLFLLLLLSVYFSLLTNSYAAHPLITDDTGTQGKGKFQLEVNGEYSYDKETEGGVTTKETGGQIATSLSYGIVDSADLVLGIPYQWGRVKEDGVVVSNKDGFSDMTLELKWRFYEKDGLSLALKPGVIIPTGDEERGLGAGRVGYSAFFIATKETDPWAFHVNIGYKRNENKVDERSDIWHASVAAVLALTKEFKAVANIVIERISDEGSNIDPASILGGFIYSVTENFDLDFGVKGGLNETETDLSLLAGMAFRF